MDANKLQKILALHALWVRGCGGKRADLRGENLRGADLRGENLRGADLRGATLDRADLRGVDLDGATLDGAYLRGVNLDGADLDGATLDGADLRGATLDGTHLRGASLRGADLRGVNLYGARGPFATAQLGRHEAWAAGGRVGIGCEVHPVEHWLEHGVVIGQNNRYTPAEIARYMGWIRLVAEWPEVA